MVSSNSSNTSFSDSLGTAQWLRQAKDTFEQLGPDIVRVQCCQTLLEFFSICTVAFHIRIFSLMYQTGWSQHAIVDLIHITTIFTYDESNPMVLHNTFASLTSNMSSHIVPHVPLCNTSTRPSDGTFPPTSLIFVAVETHMNYVT